MADRDLPETATPDRDPALEAALHTVEARMLITRHDYDVPQPVSVLIESGIVYGYDAALRSLGAATPEAQKALRELVQALAEYWRLRGVDGPASARVQQARIAADEASRTFGELAGRWGAGGGAGREG